MYKMHFIDSLPIYLIAGLILGSILLVFEFGYRLARIFLADKLNKAISPMTGGLGGLLAFILAITFSMAAGKNDARKQLVLDEANAVGTAVLRTDFLPEPYKKDSKLLLVSYINERLISKEEKKRVLKSSQSEDRVNLLIANSVILHEKLWRNAVSAYNVEQNQIIKLYIESLNQVIDIHTERVNKSLQSRIPISIWFSLILLTFLTMVLTGVQVGSQSEARMLIAALPFALAFTLVLTLIIELDRPNRSILSVSQQPLIDLQRSLSPQMSASNQPTRQTMNRLGVLHD
ncbi:hypothetical protein L4D77_10030 [Photobacterium frigidiphilum]|uniref:bestrophin-like domain n=1 Tax=Photobacterium frigidiphilum TaxID=264736 RepID=UPI003D0FC233